jgi:chlorobactene glucosyltransferase
MAVLTAGALWVGLVIWLLLRALRQSRALRRPPAVAPGAGGAVPAVAVILPVRNEIANITACLDALAAQTGLADGPAIIVVDDDSTDGTAALVERAAMQDHRITLSRLGPLPPGWMGKPRACWSGARIADAADAEWLCFIDADVEASPALLSTAVAAAEAADIDMLSLAPFQVLGSFWERLIVPAGLLLIACAIDLRRTGDPATNEIAVNGQVLLIRRPVYFAVGGHAAVRNQVCEDKALALNVKQAGWRYRFGDGRDLARTRMYRDLASLWSGFAKNAVEIVGGPAATLAIAAAGAIVGWGALLIPALAALAALAAAGAPSAAAMIGLTLCLFGSLLFLTVQLATARHLEIPLVFGLLFPAAYTAVAALALASAACRRAGRIRWKGRTYELPRSAVSSSR